MLPGRINSRDLRGKPKIRSDAHRKWVRSHFCCVPGCQQMPIDCAHVSIPGNRGVGIKASDAYTISLCHPHHMEQHQGSETFERKYKINMVALAREFFERSPHRHKLDNPYA
jgi:hypothetical protein